MCSVGSNLNIITSTYSYDALNRLKKIHDYVANNDILYTYDYNPGTSYYSLGNLVKIAYPNNATTEYEYLECCSRIGSIVTKNGSQQIIESYEYEYDLSGNRTRTDLLDGSFIGYQYDDLNRLTAAGRKLGGTWLWTRQYSYDRVGNIQQLIWRQGGAPDTLDYIYYTGTNLLKTALNKTYTYDQNGNPVSCSDGREFEYDFENRLTRLTKSSYQTDFVYNGFGDRIKKIHQTFANNNSTPPEENALTLIPSPIMEEGKGEGADIYYNDLGDMSQSPSRTNTSNEYVYDELGRQIFWKRTIDGNVTNVYYSYGYGMEARRVGSTNHYLHSDILGSITAITNASGSAMSTYEYDPYGIMLSGNTNVLGNFGFTGQEIDLETGFYHFPARYYETYWGRFLTPDPIREQTYYDNLRSAIQDLPGNYAHENDLDQPQNLNNYAYALSNPINIVDITGLRVVYCVSLGVWNDPFPYYSKEILKENWSLVGGDVIQTDAPITFTLWCIFKHTTSIKETSWRVTYNPRICLDVGLCGRMSFIFDKGEQRYDIRTRYYPEVELVSRTDEYTYPVPDPEEECKRLFGGEFGL